MERGEGLTREGTGRVDIGGHNFITFVLTTKKNPQRRVILNVRGFFFNIYIIQKSERL